MEHLPKKIHQNGISYTLVGDYYIPDLELPEESRPIGRWGRMHKAFLQEHRPGQYNALLLSGKLWTYLADLNEQAADRLACIVSQMQEAEGVTEELKARDQLAWVGGMNSIRSRAEEIILSEMIFVLRRCLSMRYRIEYADGRYCNFANGRAELLKWLKLLKQEEISDIRKVYKSGVSDSVLETYRNYIRPA